MPLDRFGREINYLRISVIDHCNLRCVYCMPLRGLSFIPSPELLTAAEIERVAEAAVSVGFRKFRLTGGSPPCAPTSWRSWSGSRPSTAWRTWP